MRGLFADDAVIRRVWAEPLLVFGGGRALLLQLAHPGVAAGVAQHSMFRAEPFRRLRHTLETIGTIAYGDDRQVHDALTTMRRVHEGITGPGYDARDPELVLWVHATVVETVLVMLERCLRPLPAPDAEQYYAECVVVAEVLGVPRDMQPSGLAEFRAWYDGMVASLPVTDEARRLARAVLHPEVDWVVEPWAAAMRQFTVSLLPDRLRRAYGLDWDLPRQALFTAAQLTARQVLPRLPVRLRMVPAALLATV